MILALAGRRIDDPNSDDCKFPSTEAPRIAHEVRALFLENAVTVLVSSAACGADLIALSEAGELGIRRRIILPYGREEFRQKSVMDRPGNWGAIYDRILDEIGAKGDLVVLDESGQADPYSATNRRIISEALDLGAQTEQAVSAAVIWDGVERNDFDYTADFRDEAHRRGLRLFNLFTLGG